MKLEVFRMVSGNVLASKKILLSQAAGSTSSRVRTRALRIVRLGPDAHDKVFEK
jgi:hypothetical protein